MLPLLVFLAAVALPPKPVHYVTDRAGVLPNATALDEKLANFERQTSDQILVYTDQHLPPDTTVEEFANEAMHQWGIGQKGKDNGAILVVFVADHKMRIEVGYGLEGSLTDAKSKEITSTIIKPAFQKGDFAGGIEQGVDAMMASAKGEAYKGTGKTVAQTTHVQTNSIAGCLIAALVFLILASIPVFIIIIIVRAVMRRGKSPYVHYGSSSSSTWDSSSSSSSSSDSFSSSSSDSGSSFDGGGGDSGGGGASDSW